MRPSQGGQKQEEGSLDLGGRGALEPVIRFSAWPRVAFIIGCWTSKEDLQGERLVPRKLGLSWGEVSTDPIAWSGASPNHHPGLQPGSQPPHPVGTQSLVYHPC